MIEFAEQLNIFLERNAEREKSDFLQLHVFTLIYQENISSRKFDFSETMSCASSDMRKDMCTMIEINVLFIDKV